MKYYKVSKLSERVYSIKYNINEKTYQVIGNLKGIMDISFELEESGFKNLEDTKEIAKIMTDSYHNGIELKGWWK